jgi:hypothetical protein
MHPFWICGTFSRREGEACGIPHLAKNERDVGHPAIVAGMEPKIRKRWRSLTAASLKRTEEKLPRGFDFLRQHGVRTTRIALHLDFSAHGAELLG